MVTSAVQENNRWVIRSSELRAPTKQEWDSYLGSVPVESQENKQPTQVGQTNSLPTFFRSLSTMVSAGVHLGQALTLLGHQHEDPGMAAVCAGLAARIRTGMALSRAMSFYPQVFPQYHLRLVAVGERTGGMDRILVELADQEEKRYRNQNRLRSALSYPAIMALIFLLVVAIVPGLALNGFSDILAGSGLEMPLIGRIFITVSNVIWNPWFWLALAVLGAALFKPVRSWCHSEKGRRLGWQIGSFIPGINTVLAYLWRLRFARALALQLKVGIHLDEAVKAAGLTAGNPLLNEKIPSVLQAIMEGTETAEALAQTEMFDNIFLSMVEVGGSTGTLPAMLRRTSDMLELELDRAQEVAFSLIEPLFLAGMGLVAGGMVLAVAVPMSRLIQSL